MAKQIKTPEKHNRVIIFIHHGKYLRMIEIKELDWQFIIAGEGIGNGKQKKDVEMAFYLNANDDVIMKWEKPKEVVKIIGKLPVMRTPSKKEQQEYEDMVRKNKAYNDAIAEEIDKKEKIPFIIATNDKTDFIEEDLQDIF